MAAIFESLAVTGSRRSDGTANATGKAWFYRPGTQTLATVYPDAAQSAPLSNPVTMNAGGKATVYFTGQVDVFIEDSAGLPISTLTLSERAERVEVRNAGFTGTLPSGSLGAGGTTDLNTILSSIAASVGGSDALVKEYTNATGRKIVDKFREMLVSVKDYGAVGNGIADDSTPIQRAANEVARLGGGILYFPPGTYLYGTQLTFSATNIIVRGAGMDATILKVASTAFSALVLSSGLTTVTIEDLQITCTGNNTSSAIAMFAARMYVNRVKISSFFTGISVSANATARAFISGCDITTVSDATAFGITLANSLPHGSPGNVITGNAINSGAGTDIAISGTVCDSCIGPGNVLKGNTNFLADNSGGSLLNILYFGNDTSAVGVDQLKVNGTDPVRSFGSRIDGYEVSVLSGATVTPDRTRGRHIVISGTSTGVAYVVAAPTPVPTSSEYALELILELKCAAGAPITGWGMNANYHVSATPSVTDGTTTTYTFVWDPFAAVWRERSRSQTTT